MIPEDGRFYCFEGSSRDDCFRWVFDADQRRWLTVCMPMPQGISAGEDGFDEIMDEKRQRAMELVKKAP